MHSFLDMLNHLDGMDRVKKRTFSLLEFRIRGDLLGFGYKGTRMLRSIGNYLHKLHLKSMYSSDVLDRVFV
jgi:hypothetical protein